jgi:hypothetical protein
VEVDGTNILQLIKCTGYVQQSQIILMNELPKILSLVTRHHIQSTELNKPYSTHHSQKEMTITSWLIVCTFVMTVICAMSAYGQACEHIRIIFEALSCIIGMCNTFTILSVLFSQKNLSPGHSLYLQYTQTDSKKTLPHQALF